MHKNSRFEAPFDQTYHILCSFKTHSLKGSPVEVIRLKWKIRIRWKIGNALPVFVLFLLLAFRPAAAVDARVITLGADLTGPQKTMVASEFGINPAGNNVPVVEVTNLEERKYLKGLAPDNVVGKRAISSALLEILPTGQGIKVQARNITWVTDDMYANALVTAGVKDVSVLVSAPFPVSGTAALIGIFKGFEMATGRPLGENDKRIANEELAETGKLGREIGQDNAARLILLVKERIAAEKTRDPGLIKQLIIEAAGGLTITLNDRQIDDIAALMQRISGLNLTAGDLATQLTGLRGDVAGAMNRPQLKSFLQRIFDVLNRVIERVRALVLGPE